MGFIKTCKSEKNVNLIKPVGESPCFAFEDTWCRDASMSPSVAEPANALVLFPKKWLEMRCRSRAILRDCKHVADMSFQTRPRSAMQQTHKPRIRTKPNSQTNTITTPTNIIPTAATKMIPPKPRSFRRRKKNLTDDPIYLQQILRTNLTNHVD
jgi:hypothetical protein